MISSTTPDKLAEIIRDTWPNLYRPPIDFRAPSDQESQTNPMQVMHIKLNIL
jgi:hypothetical protein